MTNRPTGRIGEAAQQTTSTTEVATTVAAAPQIPEQLRRRRRESLRLVPLECGHADPWLYPPPEPSERNRQAAVEAWDHLAELGYMSRCPVWQHRMAELLGVAR